MNPLDRYVRYYLEFDIKISIVATCASIGMIMASLSLILMYTSNILYKEYSIWASVVSILLIIVYVSLRVWKNKRIIKEIDEQG